MKIDRHEKGIKKQVMSEITIFHRINTNISYHFSHQKTRTHGRDADADLRTMTSDTVDPCSSRRPAVNAAGNKVVVLGLWRVWFLESCMCMVFRVRGKKDLLLYPSIVLL